MFLKRDIRKINEQLEEIKSSDTNARLVTETFDKDIVGLLSSINAVLDERRAVAIEAEKSGAELKRAITNISHDLRTPLTSALGYIQMLKDENLSGEKRAEYLEVVESRLKSLTGLMNSLFEYTRIIEKQVELKLEKVNLCNLLRDVISQFYGDFTAKGFEVDIKIPDKPVYAICAPAALERVAQNLIRNALEHGAERFELILDEKSAVFRNRVINIDALNTTQMFERFYTSDLSRSGGNAGLGLAIARELAERMGGKIEACKDNGFLSMSVVFGKGENTDGHS